MTSSFDRLRQEINNRESPEGFPVKLVAIDGHGGAGKSTIGQNQNDTIRT